VLASKSIPTIWPKNDWPPKLFRILRPSSESFWASSGGREINSFMPQELVEPLPEPSKDERDRQGLGVAMKERILFAPAPYLLTEHRLEKQEASRT